MGDEQSFSGADSAKSQESGVEKAAKSEQSASLILLPVCESPSIELLGTRANFKMNMRVISQALDIKCGIYTWV